MEIKKLLFVTRFEELWYDALQSLLNLRKAALDHVIFLNVIQRDKVAMHRGAGYSKSEEVRLREMANIRFIDWASHLYEQGMEVGVHIVVGAFVGKVVDTVACEEVDLVVLGRQKKAKLKQFYSGSDIMEIIKRSRTPVLVYKYLSENGRSVEKPFDRPLLATNWSTGSLRAVEFLKSLKGIIEQVSVVHVASEKSLRGTSAMAVQKTRKETQRKLEEICSIFEENGIDARAHVHIGDLETELERAARECQATMIVAGTTTAGTLKERWMGSTPKFLAEESDFPALLIPPAIQ
jgi:nucleotide-binding universal stress UspA family protein